MQTRAAVTIDVIRLTSELIALRAQWRCLWLEDPHAKPFQAPEWLLPWWSSFGQPDLRTLTIWQGDKLLAILPLYIYEDPISRKRQLLLIGAGTSDYLDGIFSPACTTSHVVSALRHLQREADWDVANFAQLLPHSLLFKAIGTFEQQSTEPYEGESCWRLPAASRTELPKKIRKDLRNFRNFARKGDDLEVVVANQSNWDFLFKELVRLHSDRWERKGETGVLADPAVLAWHRKAIPQLLSSGLARLTALRVKGEVIAVLYALLDGASRKFRTQYLYLIGHSSEYAQLRPGTLLMALAIEQAAAEGVHCVDLLRGEEGYKRFWNAQRTPTYGFSMRAHPQLRRLAIPESSASEDIPPPPLPAATYRNYMELS